MLEQTSTLAGCKDLQSLWLKRNSPHPTTSNRPASSLSPPPGHVAPPAPAHIFGPMASHGIVYKLRIASICTLALLSSFNFWKVSRVRSSVTSKRYQAVNPLVFFSEFNDRNFFFITKRVTFGPSLWVWLHLFQTHRYLIIH